MANVFRSRSGALPALDQNHSLGCYVDRVPVTKRFGKPRQALPSLVTQGGAFSARGHHRPERSVLYTAPILSVKWKWLHQTRG